MLVRQGRVLVPCADLRPCALLCAGDATVTGFLDPGADLDLASYYRQVSGDRQARGICAGGSPGCQPCTALLCHASVQPCQALLHEPCSCCGPPPPALAHHLPPAPPPPQVGATLKAVKGGGKMNIFVPFLEATKDFMSQAGKLTTSERRMKSLAAALAAAGCAVLSAAALSAAINA